MANKITPEQIKQMNELYLELKTYAAVSRAMGGSPAPSTVKKYIVAGYVSEKEVKAQQRKFDNDLLTVKFDFHPFLVENWGDLCELTEEEVARMDEFKKEIAI